MAIGALSAKPDVTLRALVAYARINGAADEEIIARISNGDHFET